VAKPELGTKRLCSSCSAKFYDLNKDPILCPKCGAVFEVVAPIVRGRSEAVAAAPAAARAPVVEAEVEAPEAAEVELVSLEEAEAEAEGKKVEVVDVDEDIEIEETEEAPFIEETEEGDEDVADIIGEGREDEEET
jgi:uncharacterized protein (TIGR02300 family)